MFLIWIRLKIFKGELKISHVHDGLKARKVKVKVKIKIKIKVKIKIKIKIKIKYVMVKGKEKGDEK